MDVTHLKVKHSSSPSSSSQWRRGCPSLVQVHIEVERVDIAAHLVREASERRPIRQVQMHMYLPAM